MIDENLPEGAVVDGRASKGPTRESFDYVVVGSGAAGAVAAHTLARAGHTVAIVEEGPWVKTRDFTRDVYSSFQRLMRDGATQAMEGRSFIPLLQARCVGGTTVVNSAIAWRTPEDVLDDWSARFGITGLAMRDLEPHFEAIERDLNVRTVQEEVLGGNNRGFIDRANAMGIEGLAMHRYEKGCKGSSRCLQGCPNAAKQGMNISYVPWALELGARIFTSCKVERVHIENGRAKSVLATTEAEHPVELIAGRGVLVAASTVQTPNILRRSGIRARDLGEHFQAHPGVALAGVFDKPVRMDVGATQGAESIHFRKSKRFKLETLGMPPELAAARFPGAGKALMERLATYPNVAVWAVQIRARAEGSVRSSWGGRDKVLYSLTKQDVETTREALGVLGRMMFEHGAREVWPGVFGLPTVMTDGKDVRLMEEGPTDPRAYNYVATHLFGAARMGTSESNSVVGLDFQTHAAKGLYVVDSSIFPTNLGVNPQHTIMAVARLAATRAAASPLAKVA
jgi:choline dehydrogenase-like flavoprotein